MSNITRILHLPNTLRKSSGILSVIMNYYRHIDKEKVQFDFLCFKVSEPNYSEEIKELGGRVYYIEKSLWKMDHEIKEFLKVHYMDYDVLEYHTISKWGLFLPLFRKYGVSNIIIHAHNSKYADGKLRSIRNYTLNKISLLFCTHQFACSSKAATLIFGKKNQAIIINNAIDLKRFTFDSKVRDKMRSELSVQDKVVIGNIGRLTLQKNQQFLLDIFNKLYKQNKNYHLLIIGVGELNDTLKNKVSKYNLEKSVSFLGQRHDVAELLQAIDIFLLPSLYEGLPVVGIEAQAADLPCLFSNTITNEVEIINAKFMSIECDVQIWVETVLHEQIRERHDVNDQMTKKGYNINLECEKLFLLYKEMVKK